MRAKDLKSWLEEIYSLRKSFSDDARELHAFQWDSSAMISDVAARFYSLDNGYTFEQKFRNVTDIISEFNLHGFHDVCNIFNEDELEGTNIMRLYDLPCNFAANSTERSFRLTQGQDFILPPGFFCRNTSGKSKKLELTN